MGLVHLRDTTKLVWECNRKAKGCNWPPPLGQVGMVTKRTINHRKEEVPLASSNLAVSFKSPCCQDLTRSHKANGKCSTSPSTNRAGKKSRFEVERHELSKGHNGLIKICGEIRESLSIHCNMGCKLPKNELQNYLQKICFRVRNKLWQETELDSCFQLEAPDSR